MIDALTAVGELMTLMDFTLSNARRFYSSMGNPLAVIGDRVKTETIKTDSQGPVRVFNVNYDPSKIRMRLNMESAK